MTIDRLNSIIRQEGGRFKYFEVYLKSPKNSQQNISRLNPTTHKKDHTPQPSGIHPKFAWMVQHIQISQCDTPHKQKKRQKPHGSSQ